MLINKRSTVKKQLSDVPSVFLAWDLQVVRSDLQVVRSDLQVDLTNKTPHHFKRVHRKALGARCFVFAMTQNSSFFFVIKNKYE